MTDDMFYDDSVDEDETERVRISRKGYETIWSWLRLEGQLHEITCLPADISIIDDECPLSHQVAFLLVLVLPSAERMAQQMGWDE